MQQIGGKRILKSLSQSRIRKSFCYEGCKTEATTSNEEFCGGSHQKARLVSIHWVLVQGSCEEMCNRFPRHKQRYSLTYVS